VKGERKKVEGMGQGAWRKRVSTALRLQVSGFGCQGTEVLNPDISCETTQNFNSEPQNIEYRTAECRSVESLRSVILKSAEYIIRCSMFISFLFDQTGCFLAGGCARVKLQIVKGMWNGFDFYYFYLDRIYRIIRNFFACGERPYGRRPHYPKDPVNPVQLFSLK